MSSEFRAALRRRKPERHLSPLKSRDRSELVDWKAFEHRSSLTFVIDTNVYIDRAAGRLPVPLRDLVDRSVLFHCSVAIAEIAVGVGKLHPSRHDWKAVRDHYAELFEKIPSSRMLNPDTQIWFEAGIIAGMLARMQGYQPHQHRQCLNDAAIYLTATRSGLPVLTANRNDFDLIQQLAPEGSFVVY